MTDLSAECEKEIQRIVAAGGTNASTYDMLREAMRFAYADAARVCREGKSHEAPSDGETALYNLGVQDCECAILARASKPGD